MLTVERNRNLQRHGEPYLLGYSEDEELRLRKQAEELRHESARLFDRIGLASGSRAVDLGCGPQGVLEMRLSQLKRPQGTEVTIMQFENLDTEDERAQHCPECGMTTHSPDCSRCGKTAMECVPYGYDYRNLVGSPSQQHDEGFDVVQFDALLTADDRNLLRFGMHIAW